MFNLEHRCNKRDISVQFSFHSRKHTVSCLHTYLHAFISTPLYAFREAFSLSKQSMDDTFRPHFSDDSVVKQSPRYITWTIAVNHQLVSECAPPCVILQQNRTFHVLKDNKILGTFLLHVLIRLQNFHLRVSMPLGLPTPPT